MKNNKYVKATTKDLFSNEIVYCYINTETGEEIYSSNPNLFEELNKN